MDGRPPTVNAWLAGRPPRPPRTRGTPRGATFPPDPDPAAIAAMGGGPELGPPGEAITARSDLDARIEAIARRVAQEVLKERRRTAPDR
jgi:hypothetical protein